ncbi:hypothetical protein FD755_001856, partial [Muntiacus reevesi]
PLCGLAAQMLILEKSTVHKSVISVQPPWTTVFRGERVNLTCNGFHFYAQEKLKGYRWFSGKARPRETPGNTLEVRDSGQYRCQAPGSLPSNPVHLIFSSASLILQVPYSVFEGDELVLRCQKRGREKLAFVKYTWNQKIISGSDESLDLLIPKASLNNSGCYQCIAFLENAYVLRASQTNVQIQELFSRPKLEVTDSQPIEGNPVNLTCGTRLPLERPDTPLRFGFFREDGVVISNWSRSPDLQITAMWREDSGSYWCGAETVTGGIRKRSLPLQIDVQRIPVSGVFLETQPQEDQVVEGEMLVLVCSVAKGSGNTTFSWHREDTRESLGQKSQLSQRAELEIPVIWESHAGRYYCTADNGYGLIQSEAVNITVRSKYSSELMEMVPAVQEPFHSLGMILCDFMLIHCFVALQEQPHIISTFLWDCTTFPAMLYSVAARHQGPPSPEKKDIIIFILQKRKLKLKKQRTWLWEGVAMLMAQLLYNFPFNSLGACPVIKPGLPRSGELTCLPPNRCHRRVCISPLKFLE